MASSNNNIIHTLPKSIRPYARFVKHQEEASGLSTSRFIQDVSTCLIPKALFSRSLADLSENTFLEVSEETLIYFVPALLGEKAARKIFSAGLNDNLKAQVAKRGTELVKKAKTDIVTRNNNKEVLPVKAAIALCAMAIPFTEYTLNYIKNLLTLKVFKKSDFKNIASLDNTKEDAAQQQKVKNSAIKHIKFASTAYGACLALAGLLACKGKNSKILRNISEFIVAPGEKLFKNAPKAKDFVNKYFCMDFNNQNGKLVLSKGQLTTCVLVGGAGYFGASADRGKENLKETATRFPLVALYVITGSELAEKGFRKLLHKFGKCRDLIKDDDSVLKFNDLEGKARSLAKTRGTSFEKEYCSLVKQKILISGLPYIFSIGVMGFFVAWMTNYFTRKRFATDDKNSGKPFLMRV